MLKNQKGPGTVVGANVKLQGTLRDTSDIIVYGQVEGEVISDESVTVEQDASIKGPVTAKIVTLSGIIRGAVEAKEKLEILPSGKLVGSIATSNLIIHSGATFNGKATMAGEKELKSTSNKVEKSEQTSQKSPDEMFSDLEVEIE